MKFISNMIQSGNQLLDQSLLNTDLSLIQRLGDSRYRSQAWSEFLERYTRLFFSWFRHWGVEPSIMEDVLQETMIRILGDIRGFEHQNSGSFRSWMRALAHNSWNQLLLDAERHLAQRKVSPLQAQHLNLLHSRVAENHLIELFDLMAARELVDLAHSRVRSRVDAETWETYSLITLQHKQVADVTESQKITTTQLYNRIYRVRKLLKTELENLESLSA
jgi:DNA-directed RNA polymerase specialized sigma24 family protein